jgi:hypothetical protein
MASKIEGVAVLKLVFFCVLDEPYVDHGRERSIVKWECEEHGEEGVTKGIFFVCVTILKEKIIENDTSNAHKFSSPLLNKKCLDRYSILVIEIECVVVTMG